MWFCCYTCGDQLSGTLCIFKLEVACVLVFVFPRILLALPVSPSRVMAGKQHVCPADCCVLNVQSGTRPNLSNPVSEGLVAAWKGARLRPLRAAYGRQLNSQRQQSEWKMRLNREGAGRDMTIT